MFASIQAGTCEILGISIEETDVEVRRVEREGFAASTVMIGQGEEAQQISLVLDMNDTPALLSKGLARDITRRIQSMRKDLNLAIEATIDLEIWTQNAPEMFEQDREWIVSETRAAAAVFHLESDTPSSDTETFEVDGTSVWFTVK
tara:strand:- start:412 stop:849 length:438 start_codon:yes stop_codon:yes gene_type:complete